MPNWEHISKKNIEVNLVSQSEIIFFGSPVKGNTRSLKSFATPSVSIVSLHRIRITALVQLWSVMVMRESYPSDKGSLTMKSTAIVSKGSAPSLAEIGSIGGLFL
jgi:hypothetical protein